MPTQRKLVLMSKLIAIPERIANLPKLKQYSVYVSDSIALRVNLESEPHNAKIANLQKGIIFVYNKIDVVGEGTGFGVPVLKYAIETYFSSSSTLQIQKLKNHVFVRKEFIMDTVERTEFRNLSLKNRRIIKMFNAISNLYQKHKRIARGMLLLKPFFLKVGVKERFTKTKSRGKVVVNYKIFPTKLSIRMDYALVEKTNLQKIFALNEQSAQFFRIYSDSSGARLVDEEIGAWQKVTADSAKIVSDHDAAGFSLNQINGSIMRRGRELLVGSLNWIGLDYEISSLNDSFEYEIKLFWKS